MNTVFEVNVREQAERLQKQSCRAIEAEVARKRVAWLDQNGPQVKGLISPRQAFELLFFGYMGLSENDLVVVKETGREIEWRSQDPCPTLEACQELKLDTRRVCRAAYEKSTQAFLSWLDPQLRFLRNYEEIRPYAPYCKEWILLMDFEDMMALAIEEARISRREGNKGCGAGVAFGSRVVGRAHDSAATEKDASLHAEVNAIRQAARTLGDANLSGAVLFSTCEPCPMCSSLAV